MGFGIERHCPRAALRLQSLDNRQFPWRYFSRDYRRAVSARSERELTCVIERTAINAGANRNRVDDLSAFGIEHHHHFVGSPRTNDDA